MASTEIRTGFDQMIAAARAAGNVDAAARLELAREYFANLAFRAKGGLCG